MANDIIEKEDFKIKLSGKMRMNYVSFQEGDIVYAIFKEENSKEGVIVFEKYLSMGRYGEELIHQKRTIDSKESEIE